MRRPTGVKLCTLAALINATIWKVFTFGRWGVVVMRHDGAKTYEVPGD